MIAVPVVVTRKVMSNNAPVASLSKAAARCEAISLTLGNRLFFDKCLDYIHERIQLSEPLQSRCKMACNFTGRTQVDSIIRLVEQC